MEIDQFHNPSTNVKEIMVHLHLLDSKLIEQISKFSKESEYQVIFSSKSFGELS